AARESEPRGVCAFTSLAETTASAASRTPAERGLFVVGVVVQFRVGVALVQAFAHFLAVLEERHRLLRHRHMRAGARIAAGARRPGLDREGAQAGNPPPNPPAHGGENP